jgi:hypothetical protein
LIRKNKHGVLGEGVSDRRQIRRLDLRGQVDVADLCGEARRDGIDTDGHDLVLGT